MTLAGRISLIDALIREHPEYTIRDYLDIVAEIEQIKPPIKEPIMMPRTFTAVQELFILENHEEKTVKEMAAALVLPEETIYNYCHRHKLKYKSGKIAGASRERTRIREGGFAPDPPRIPIVRPAADYNNIKSNYA